MVIIRATQSTRYTDNPMEISSTARIDKPIKTRVAAFRRWPRPSFLALATCLALLSLDSILFSFAAVAQEATVQLDQLSSAHDHLFPNEMKAWRNRSEYVVDGIKKAESFRRALLATDSTGKPGLERIAEKLAEFQSASRPHLIGHASITNFKLATERLHHQLTGQEKISPNSFDAFNGRWFGVWGDSEVNHDWQPTQIFRPSKSYADVSPKLESLQYAWISNGFGWNYLVAFPSDGHEPADTRRACVLGMVYYFTGDNFETISGSKAHVGFADSPTRLVWITEREVFLEEVFAGDTPAKDTYVITAMYHDLLSDSPTVSRRATQAVYTRNPANRPDFFEFRW